MNIVKEYVKLQLADRNWNCKLKKMNACNKAKAILIGTPSHGNLGDHAIAEEEKNFLNVYFPEYELFEILMPMYHVCKRKIKETVRPGDIIFISGGGWMGNLWIHNENVIRDVISSYPDNQVVIFPQTIFYSDDENGKMECKKTAKIISGHSNLFLFLRDEKSYSYAKQHFLRNSSISISLYPDIVLYGSLTLENINQIEQKDIVNVCLRKDCESILNSHDNVINTIKKYYRVREISTVVPRKISLKNRTREIMLCWKEFAEARLTVTDRLHGMLFSVLNGTPCIALDNKTGKVFGVFSWIREQNMVFCVSSVEEIDSIIKHEIDENKKTYDRKKLGHEFENMSKEIRKGITYYENKKIIGN